MAENASEGSVNLEESANTSVVTSAQSPAHKDATPGKPQPSTPTAGETRPNAPANSKPKDSQKENGQKGTQPVAETGVVKPAANTPVAVKPVAVKPGAAKPGAAKPGAAKPGVVKPGVVKPGVVRPGVVKPGVVKPGVVKPGVVKSGVVKPGVVKPVAVKVGSVKAGISKAGTTKGGAAKAGTGKAGTTKPKSTEDVEAVTIEDPRNANYRTHMLSMWTGHRAKTDTGEQRPWVIHDLRFGDGQYLRKTAGPDSDGMTLCRDINGVPGFVPQAELQDIARNGKSWFDLATVAIVNDTEVEYPGINDALRKEIDRRGLGDPRAKKTKKKAEMISAAHLEMVENYMMPIRGCEKVRFALVDEKLRPDLGPRVVRFDDIGRVEGFVATIDIMNERIVVREDEIVPRDSAWAIRRLEFIVGADRIHLNPTLPIIAGVELNHIQSWFMLDSMSTLEDLAYLFKVVPTPMRNIEPLHRRRRYIRELMPFFRRFPTYWNGPVETAWQDEIERLKKLWALDRDTACSKVDPMWQVPPHILNITVRRLMARSAFARFYQVNAGDPINSAERTYGRQVIPDDPEYNPFHEIYLPDGAEIKGIDQGAPQPPRPDRVVQPSSQGGTGSDGADGSNDDDDDDDDAGGAAGGRSGNGGGASGGGGPSLKSTGLGPRGKKRKSDDDPNSSSNKKHRNLTSTALQYGVIAGAGLAWYAGKFAQEGHLTVIAESPLVQNLQSGVPRLLSSVTKLTASGLPQIMQKGNDLVERAGRVLYAAGDESSMKEW